jgi:uncharacterized protein (TIGR03437 family)
MIASPGPLRNSGFVMRFSADGSAVDYSTTLDNGGVSLITADSSGRVAITQGTLLSKLDASGGPLSQTQLPFLPARIATAPDGSLYGAAEASAVAGPPPVTGNAYQKTIDSSCPNYSGPPFRTPQERLAAMTDVYIFKLSAEDSTLQLATLLGGSCRDAPTDLSIGGDGSIWVAGITSSVPFPSVDPISAPPQSGTITYFAAHLDATLSQLLFSTYFETSFPAGYSESARIAAGPDGSAYVSGNSYQSPSIQFTGAQLWKISPSASPAPFSISQIFSAYGNSINVSPVDIVAIHVPGLVPADEVDLPLNPPGGPPLQLAGVSVAFNGMAAQLLSVHRDSVLCITPAGLSGTAFADVQVKNGDAVSPGFIVPVGPSDVAFFLQVRNADGSLNSPDNPASSGSTVSFFVIGAGWLPVSFQLGYGLYGPRTDSIAPEPLEGFVNGIYELRAPAPSASGAYQMALFPLPELLIPVNIAPPTITLYVR